MANTKKNIDIDKEDGWIVVLTQAGFVTVNNSCFYAYSHAKPNSDIKGNYTSDKQINNVSNSSLWLKVNRYPLLVTPNEI